jgi:hypothetical protein
MDRIGLNPPSPVFVFEVLAFLRLSPSDISFAHAIAYCEAVSALRTHISVCSLVIENQSVLSDFRDDVGCKGLCWQSFTRTAPCLAVPLYCSVFKHSM